MEPAIPTPAGIRYPDLVIWKNGLCVVVDTTIVFDHKPPDDAHERKVKYYDQPAIRDWCELVSGVAADEVKFSACVLTWRGVPSQRSVRELRTLGVTKSNWLLLSVKTLEGGHASYSHFTKAFRRFLKPTVKVSQSHGNVAGPSIYCEAVPHRLALGDVK